MTVSNDFDRANNQDWEAEFTLINDEVSPPVRHEISGSVVRLQLRPTPESPDIIFGVELAANFDEKVPINLTIVDPEAGKIRLSVRGARMRQIAAGSYVYDIVVKRPTGRAYRPVKGILTLAQGVTDLP